MMKKKGKNWIKAAVSKHPGALHRELKVKPGEKIPQSKLTKSLHSENPKMRKQAIMARTLSGFRK